MRCITRYDRVMEESTTEQELLDGFAAKLVETIVEEAPMHRLWYDLRIESMFDAGCATPCSRSTRRSAT